MRRQRVVPLLPPLVLAAVALAQFGLAQTTPLSPWKLGGFGMFSTTDTPGFRVLRVEVETDDGRYIVPGPVGSAWTRTWPRPAALRAEAGRAACGAWRLTPMDSVATVPFSDPHWAAFYASPSVRERTEMRGVATPAGDADTPAPVRAARAVVWWSRMTPGAEGGQRLTLQRVASETVTAHARCR